MITLKKYKEWYKRQGDNLDIRNLPEEIKEFNRRKSEVVSDHDWYFFTTRNNWPPGAETHEYLCKNCKSKGVFRSLRGSSPPPMPNKCLNALTCEEAQIQDIIE